MGGAYIDFVKDYFIKSGIASFYPSFMKELDYYEGYFSTHSLVNKISHENREQFQAIIEWGGSSLYSLEWDITGIHSFLKNHPLPITFIPAPNEKSFCDEKNVFSDTVDKYANDLSIRGWDPILLVWIDFIDMYYIIDGNHRYLAACQRGQDTIDAIILPSGLHLKYMLSEESRMRYKIFHNISIMSNIYQHLGCKVTEGWDDRDTLYPISNNMLLIGGI